MRILLQTLSLIVAASVSSFVTYYKLTENSDRYVETADLVELGSGWHFGAMEQYGGSYVITLQDSNGYCMHIRLQYSLTKPNDTAGVFLMTAFHNDSTIEVQPKSDLESRLIKILTSCYFTITPSPHSDTLAESIISIIKTRHGRLDLSELQN